ncbi:MAG: hypothetical protein KGL35_14855 [Bradyrhizobium sp.]|nr:hypothetical protein [Bradyrhizobium sp.]
MADTVSVTFTRPVRVNKKRYPKGATADISSNIAGELIELGAAVETSTPAQKDTTKKA